MATNGLMTASQTPLAIAKINVPTYKHQYTVVLPPLPSPQSGVAAIVIIADSRWVWKVLYEKVLPGSYSNGNSIVVFIQLEV